MKQISAVLKKLEYGIYVVSMGKGNDGNAFTASWLTQISAEPPTIALSINNKHQSARILKEDGKFVVNLLGEGQEGVAKTYFGPAESGYEKLRNAEVTSAPYSGCPLIPGASGYLDCQVIESVTVGNHTLFVAEVKEAELDKDTQIMTTTNSKLHYTG